MLDRDEFDELAKELIESAAAMTLLEKHRQVEGERPYSLEKIDADFWYTLNQSISSMLTRKVNELES